LLRLFFVTQNRWRHFYVLLTGIVAFDTVMEYVVDTLADAGVYFSGSWYDSTTAACLAGMTFAALMAYVWNPCRSTAILKANETNAAALSKPRVWLVVGIHHHSRPCRN
jgi:hypothetical protein